MSATRSRRSSGVSTPVTASIIQLREGLAQAIANMLGRRYDSGRRRPGWAPSLDQRRQGIDQRVSFGSVCAPDPRRVATKVRRPDLRRSGCPARYRPRPRRPHPRRKICGSRRSALARRSGYAERSEAAAGEEPTQRIKASVPQKARRRSAGPRQPGDHAEAVVENGFLKIEMVLREPIGNSVVSCFGKARSSSHSPETRSI